MIDTWTDGVFISTLDNVCIYLNALECSVIYSSHWACCSKWNDRKHLAMPEMFCSTSIILLLALAFCLVSPFPSFLPFSCSFNWIHHHMPQQMSITTRTNESKTHRKNLPSFVKKLWMYVLEFERAEFRVVVGWTHPILFRLLGNIYMMYIIQWLLFMKTNSIVNDPETNHLICWSQQGDAIWIPDASNFSKAVLPRYFKHNNWQSFVRQLNRKCRRYTWMINAVILTYNNSIWLS